MKSYGQIAYEAYCESTEWRSLVTKAPLPQWNNVKPEIQNAWIKAANAVINEFTFSQNSTCVKTTVTA